MVRSGDCHLVDTSHDRGGVMSDASKVIERVLRGESPRAVLQEQEISVDLARQLASQIDDMKMTNPDFKVAGGSQGHAVLSELRDLLDDIL